MLRIVRMAALLVLAAVLTTACAGTGAGEDALLLQSSDKANTAAEETAAESESATRTLDDAAPTEESVDLSQGIITTTADSLWLADLTWTEVAERIATGHTSVIVPTGGTEQNGPHLALGKHNIVVEHTAANIARRAGSTLIAPVLDYVPEGDPALMDNHLQWAGTISVPDPTFAAVLDATARSLKGHGFSTIVFLGDSGSSQAAQAATASALSVEWAAEGVVVANMSEYFGANGQTEWLIAQGETDATIGIHAGIRDTSEVLAIAPEFVRTDAAVASASPAGQLDPVGVDGDPSRASVTFGETLLQLKIDIGTAELQRLQAR